MELKKPNLSLKQRESLAGYLFTLPFVLGFIFLFLIPFLQSIVFSLSELSLTPKGYELEFVGLQNYYRALFVDADFIRVFTDTVVKMVTDVPVILVFSFFAALLLNQEFKGRLLARLIFFLPVILGAGIILRLEQTDEMLEILQSSPATGITPAVSMSTAAAQRLLVRLRLPAGFVEYIIYAIEHIPELIRASGIQILIFLSGLQSIPSSLYEAADVEGASRWESFWMLTLPLLSPLILTNIVYSIIDFFVAADRNELMEHINNTVFMGAGYGAGTAMSWIYLFVVLIFLGLSMWVISRWVYYQE